MGKDRNALERWDEIERRLAGRRPAVFLDYDGTLAPIAPRPELAVLPEPTRTVLRRLAEHSPVAILSGRGREDVAALVGLDELTYAGSHGFDIAGPTLRREVGEGIPERIEEASEKLRRRLDGIAGVLVEPKRFSVAVHFRLADPADLPRIEEAVDAVRSELPDLRKVPGKKIFELRPDLDWDKGHALLWLLESLHPEGMDAGVIPFYLGDDVTDEDAFLAIADRGIGILVAEEPHETAAAYTLRSPEEVREFLERVGLSPGEGSLPPREGRLSPREGSDSPGEGRLSPREGRLSPGEGRFPPGEGKLSPGGGRLSPGEGNDSPGEGSGSPREGRPSQQ